jgi:hypothetical protein
LKKHLEGADYVLDLMKMNVLDVKKALLKMPPRLERLNTIINYYIVPLLPKA